MIFTHRRYHFRNAASPTHVNLRNTLQSLGWRAAPCALFAQCSDQQFDFDPCVANTLEYKHYFQQFADHYQLRHIPETYTIDDASWPQVMQHIQASEERLGIQKPWILKPALRNNGEGITLLQRIDHLETHYTSHQRFSGPHVVQAYISDPKLLRGHKFSIRMFVIFSTTHGIFLYRHGYCNVAKTPYPYHDFSNRSPHITNEHLHPDTSNVIQIPSQEFDFFNASVYPAAREHVQRLCCALGQAFPTTFQSCKQQRLAIFGFDFLLDAQHTLWLLEANHGPCFPTDASHPLQNYLYVPFWTAFAGRFIEHTMHPDFEKLG